MSHLGSMSLISPGTCAKLCFLESEMKQKMFVIGQEMYCDKLLAPVQCAWVMTTLGRISHVTCNILAAKQTEMQVN